jgi:hypothetical protein
MLVVWMAMIIVRIMTTSVWVMMTVQVVIMIIVRGIIFIMSIATHVPVEVVIVIIAIMFMMMMRIGCCRPMRRMQSCYIVRTNLWNFSRIAGRSRSRMRQRSSIRVRKTGSDGGCSMQLILIDPAVIAVKVVSAVTFATIVIRT